MGPLPSVTVVLADGVERQFRLSFGAIRRLRDKHKINVLELAESMQTQPIESFAAIIYEGLVERDSITQDQVEDLCDMRLMPHFLEVVMQAMRNPRERPTVAAPTEGAEAASDSKTYGQSGPTILEFPATNSGN